MDQQSPGCIDTVFLLTLFKNLILSWVAIEPVILYFLSRDFLVFILHEILLGIFDLLLVGPILQVTMGDIESITSKFTFSRIFQCSWTTAHKKWYQLYQKSLRTVVTECFSLAQYLEKVRESKKVNIFLWKIFFWCVFFNFDFL